jgi:hypothetical protein
MLTIPHQQNFANQQPLETIKMFTLLYIPKFPTPELSQATTLFHFHKPPPHQLSPLTDIIPLLATFNHQKTATTNAGIQMSSIPITIPGSIRSRLSTLKLRVSTFDSSGNIVFHSLDRDPVPVTSLKIRVNGYDEMGIWF